MFTPHYIEFKGFVVIGTNFFFQFGAFLIGLDQTGQVCVMCFATSSKGSVSRSSVPVQGDWTAASSG